METVLRFFNFLFNKFMETMRKMRGERNKIQGKYGENKGSKKNGGKFRLNRGVNGTKKAAGWHCQDVPGATPGAATSPQLC